MRDKGCMTSSTSAPVEAAESSGPVPRPRRRRVKRALIATGLSLALLTGGTATWAVNRYVIDHVQISDVDAYEAAATAGGAAVAPTSSGAEDADIDVRALTLNTDDGPVSYYVADVTLDDATALRSAFAQNKFGTNIVEDTSDIAADNDAVFAINGDYYGFRSTGIVIRNGVVYRDSPAREGLAFYRDGSVKVYDETATTADALVAGGVWNTLSFGPALVVDGAVQTDLEGVSIDRNFGNRSISGDNPRTVIGVVDDNHLLFVVVDGRSATSAGLTLAETAELMKSLGAQTAYNLDGGGSSTMVYDGQLVNRPQGGTDERGTSDILYIEA